MSDVPQGLYVEVSHADYHADLLRDVPTLSASIAHKIVSRSPWHGWAAHPRLGGGKFESSEEMEYGNLMHGLVLGVGQDVVEVDSDAWRTNAAKEARDAARAAGKLPVLAFKAQAARARAAIIRDKIAALGIPLEGQSEVTAVWQDDDVWCRGRIDHWLEGKGIAIDLKFCADAEPAAFSRALVSHGSDLQAHAYTSALGAIFPDLAGRIEWRYIAVEGDTPYVYSVSGAFRELGRSRWNRAVSTWRECLKTGRWPSYQGEVSCPDWAMAQEQMAALTGGSEGVGF